MNAVELYNDLFSLGLLLCIFSLLFGFFGFYPLWLIVNLWVLK
ncbi:hypothetical protein SAMN04487888_101242 [Eubacterium callanderi]|uniref:Uncharacterized protein n=1 Tax=Inoviridae sp. ctO6A5 TaxID=2826760 RepID=A0A8S5M552_9VIRU|nr:hypothetical protein SAMN04487888_101242 [Eubacterium callanderi]DAD77340.1 MAG TPA: hypothetical protein [Inoviridae sp. ctO6A5]